MGVLLSMLRPLWAPFRILGKAALIGAGGLIGIIIVLAIVISISSGGGGDEPEAVSIGQPAKTANWQVIVPEPPEVTDVVGRGIIAEKAAGQFVIVRLELTNIGDKGSTFSDWQLELVDEENRIHKPADFSVQSAAGGGLFLEQLNPGVSKSVLVVFDVARDVDKLRLKVQGALFSDPAIIDLGPLQSG